MPAGGSGGALAGGDVMGGALGLFLVQAVVVISLTRVLAVGLQYVHQPRVIAEVIGGILLGPSFLGSLCPGFTQTVFPRHSIDFLTLVASLGLILYLFLVGIELDPRTMVSNIRKTFLIASFGIATPFAFGWLLAPFLFREVMEPSLQPGAKTVAMSSFAVFICVAISITAFPVLARIMNETKLLRTPVGITALGAAALDDVTAWSLLALSFALIHASEPAVAAYIILAVTGYALFVLLAVRPLWWRIVDRVEETGSHTLQARLLAFTFLLLFASAWVTEALGVHAIFGGFLLGLIMPRGHGFTMAVTEKCEDLVQIVFLPLYFAASGLKTDINSLRGARSVGLLVLVLAVSVTAKLVGCGLGARLTGLGWRESVTVGVLMNTRGLVELIVLNMGLEAKVINVELFTIMVLVALITTFMTTPMVALIYPPNRRTPLAPLLASPSSARAALASAGLAAPHHPDLLVTRSGSTAGLLHPAKALLSPGALPPYRLVLVLERLEEMPALTNLLYLLKAANNKQHNPQDDDHEDDEQQQDWAGGEEDEQQQQEEGRAGSKQSRGGLAAAMDAEEASSSSSSSLQQQHDLASSGSLDTRLTAATTGTGSSSSTMVMGGGLPSSLFSSSLLRSLSSTSLGRASSDPTLKASSSTKRASSSSKASPPPPPQPLSLVALHFTDASTACSDLLRATMPDVAKSTDPTLYMIKVFGELVGASVSTESVVGPPHHFAAHLSTRARGADLTIVPYKEQRHRADAVLGLDYHEKFVQSAIAKATSPLAVLLNPRCGTFHGMRDEEAREVLLIVTGQGPNDREAIQVCRRLQQGMGCRGGRGLAMDVLLLEPDATPPPPHTRPHQQQQRRGAPRRFQDYSAEDNEDDDDGEEEKAEEEGRAQQQQDDEEGQQQDEARKRAAGGGVMAGLVQELKKTLRPRDIEQVWPPRSSGGAVPAKLAAMALLRQRAQRRPYEFIIFGAGKLPVGWDPVVLVQQQQQPQAGASSSSSSSSPAPPGLLPTSLPSLQHQSTPPLSHSSSSSELLVQSPTPRPPGYHHLQHHPLHQHLQPPPPLRSLSPLTALAHDVVSSASPRLSRRATLLGDSSMARALAEVKAPLLVVYAPAAHQLLSSTAPSSSPWAIDPSSSGLPPPPLVQPPPRRYQSYAQALLTGQQQQQQQPPPSATASQLPPRPPPSAPAYQQQQVAPPAL